MSKIDRDQAEELNNYYQMQDIPSLIVLRSDGGIFTVNGVEEFEPMNTIEKWARDQTIFWTR